MDGIGNTAADDDTLCKCPGGTECQMIADKASGFPVELQGGYCITQ